MKPTKTDRGYELAGYEINRPDPEYDQDEWRVNAPNGEWEIDLPTKWQCVQWVLTMRVGGNQ